MFLLAAWVTLLIAEPRTFQSPPTLRPGTVYELRIRQQRIVNGQTTRVSSGTVLLVYHPNDRGSHQLRVTIDTRESMTEAQMSALNTSPQDFIVTANFELDERLQPERLVNWQELAEQGTDLSTRMFTAMVDLGTLTEERADAMLKMGRETMATHDAVFGMYTQRFLPYYQGHGLQLAAHEPITQTSLLRIDSVPEPLPTTYIILLEDDPGTPGLVEYSMTQQLNIDDLADAGQHRLDSLVEENKVDMKSILKNVNLQIKTIWACDPASMLVVTAEHTRRMQISGEQDTGTETWTWELVSPTGSP